MPEGQEWSRGVPLCPRAFGREGEEQQEEERLQGLTAAPTEPHRPGCAVGCAVPSQFAQLEEWHGSALDSGHIP